jgi:hypothetical protein
MFDLRQRGDDFTITEELSDELWIKLLHDAIAMGQAILSRGWW